MITVNGWCAGGKVGVGGGGREKGGMSVQSMGEVGKDFCPNVLQSFLENFDRRSCDDGGWQLIPAITGYSDLKNSSSIYIVLPEFPHCKCVQTNVLEKPDIPMGRMETALPTQKWFSLPI